MYLYAKRYALFFHGLTQHSRNVSFQVVVIPDAHGQTFLSRFLVTLVPWCISPAYSTLQIRAASELFATLVNKYTNGVYRLHLHVTGLYLAFHVDASDFLDYMLKSYCPSTLSDPHGPAEDRRRGIDNWVSVRFPLNRQFILVY